MRPPSKRIQQEAMLWVVKADLNPLSEDEGAELQSWLARDPRHRGAYARACAVRVRTERVAALAGGVAPRLKHSAPVATAAIAAGIVALAVTAAVWIYPSAGERYSSGVGELRKVALDDGSRMYLNTATQAIVRFDESVRQVDLPEGEALFEVAKDAARPFQVRAGDATVRAVGTVFTVHHDATRVEVTVAEGVVEISYNGGAQIRRLTADHQALIVRDRPLALQVLPPAETRRQLSWSSGQLEFDGQTLGAAVAEMNRHNRRQIVITDRALASRPVVGVFQSSDIDSFARIAAEALGAEMVVEGDTIRLRSKVAR